MRYMIILFVSICCLHSAVIELKKGWNLISVGSELDPSILLEKESINHIWGYDKNWMLAADVNILENAQQPHPQLTKLKPSKGYWVYSTSSISLELPLQQTQIVYDDLNTGWNLLGVGEKSYKLAESFKQNYKIAWKYKDDKWLGYSPDEATNQLLKELELNEFKQLQSHEGFWVFFDQNPDGLLKVDYSETYAVKLLTYTDGEINYASNIDIYDETDTIVASTDSYANAILPKKGYYKIKSDYYEDLDLYLDSYGIYPYILENKTDIYGTESNLTKSGFFDLGDWSKKPQNIFLEAKPIPKIFFDISKEYGLIIKNFYVEQDITITINEITPQSDLNIAAAMEVGLLDSNKEVLDAQDLVFEGEFKPIFYDKDNSVNPHLNYLVYWFDNNAKEWIYLSKAYYSKSGKLIGNKYVDKIGKYAFVGVDKLNTLTGIVKDCSGNLIQNFFIMEDSLKVTPFTNGSFELSHSDTTSIKVFADGYKTKEVKVNTLEKVITLEKEKSSPPVLLNIEKLNTAMESIGYGKIVLFKDMIVNFSSKGLIEFYDKTSLQLLKKIKLSYEYLYDAAIVFNDYLYIATFGGNIWKFSTDFKYEKVYTVDNSFVCNNGGFIFEPSVDTNDEITTWITNNGCIVQIGKQGLAMEKQLSVDKDDSVNKIYNLKDSYRFSTFSGKLYDISKQNLSFSNYYNFQQQLSKSNTVINNDFSLFKVKDTLYIDQDNKIELLQQGVTSPIETSKNKLFFSSGDSFGYIDLSTMLFHEIMQIDANIYLLKYISGKILAFLDNGRLLQYHIDTDTLKNYTMPFEVTQVNSIENRVFFKTADAEIYIYDF